MKEPYCVGRPSEGVGSGRKVQNMLFLSTCDAGLPDSQSAVTVAVLFTVLVLTLLSRRCHRSSGVHDPDRRLPVFSEVCAWC